MSAKLCKHCNEHKPISSFNKGRRQLYGVGSYCKPCLSVKASLYYEKNKARIKAKTNLWKEQNKVEDQARAKIYRENHKAAKARTNRTWQLNNKDKCAANFAKYRASKLSRTPAWLRICDLVEINWAYKIAKDRSIATGIPYEVDHIIPLQGPNVSGLHVPWNMQVITAKANVSKGNRV